MPESPERVRSATEELVYYEDKVISRCRGALGEVLDPKDLNNQTLERVINPRSLSESVRTGWANSERWVGLFLLHNDSQKPDKPPAPQAKTPSMRFKPGRPMFDGVTDFFIHNQEIVEYLMRATKAETWDKMGKNAPFYSYAESLILKYAVYHQTFARVLRASDLQRDH